MPNSFLIIVTAYKKHRKKGSTDTSFTTMTGSTFPFIAFPKSKKHLAMM